MFRPVLIKSLTRSIQRASGAQWGRHLSALSPLQSMRFNSSSTTITTDGSVIPKSVLELSISQYHQHADETLEGMILDLEELMDTEESVDLDAELTSGILTLSIPNNGDYVINKQPPNKQIWLSSPISGPKRFDYLDGEWVSLRDNVKLLDLMSEELRDGLGMPFEFTKE